MASSSCLQLACWQLLSICTLFRLQLFRGDYNKGEDGEDDYKCNDMLSCFNLTSTRESEPVVELVTSWRRHKTRTFICVLPWHHFLLFHYRYYVGHHSGNLFFFFFLAIFLIFRTFFVKNFVKFWKKSLIWQFFSFLEVFFLVKTSWVFFSKKQEHIR